MQKKPQPFTQTQVDTIKAIKPGPKQGSKMKRLAKTLGRPLSAIYAKWNYEMKKAGIPFYNKDANRGGGRKKPVVVAVPVAIAAPQNPLEVQPYVLETGAPPPTRSSKMALRDLKRRLVPLIDAMVVTQSVPIFTAQKSTVRNWLAKDKNFVGKVFTISEIKGNKKMSRIHRTF